MKIRNRFINRSLAQLGTWLLRAYYLTIRVDHRRIVPGATPYESPNGKARYCFCLWHDAIVTCLFASRIHKLSGLISRHQDGTYLSDAATSVGLTPVRGSTSRGGAEAIKQLIDQSDLHVCITPDGPRGPRRVMKEGIVYLASRTGRPIVPTTVTATSFWSLPGNWSDMLIPKPFSKALLLAGTPIEVPQNASRAEIAVITECVQQEMDRLDLLGLRIIRGDESAAKYLAETGAYPDDRLPLDESQLLETPSCPDDIQPTHVQPGQAA